MRHRVAPGCLVLDVQLPGLNGLELQETLKGAACPIPIIFITGHGDIPMSVRAIKAGAVDFLAKPFHDEDLLRAVQEAIAQGEERNMHAVGNEADPQAIAQAQDALNDVVVTRQLLRAAVAEMREHRQACITGGAKTVDRSIGVAGGDDDALAR